MYLFTKEYREHFFLNDKQVTPKKFEKEFEKDTKGTTLDHQLWLAEQIINGDIIYINKNKYHYEERDVMTGEIKNKKY